MMNKLKARLTGRDKRGFNVRLLRKVATYIEEHPDRYDQSNWAAWSDGVLDMNTVPIARQHLCQTSACVAGTASFLSGTFLANHPFGSDVVDWLGSGQTALGLDAETAEFLFDMVRSEEHMPTLLRKLADGATWPDLEALEYELDLREDCG